MLTLKAADSSITSGAAVADDLSILSGLEAQSLKAFLIDLFKNSIVPSMENRLSVRHSQVPLAPSLSDTPCVDLVGVDCGGQEGLSQPTQNVFWSQAQVDKRQRCCPAGGRRSIVAFDVGDEMPLGVLMSCVMVQVRACFHRVPCARGGGLRVRDARLRSGARQLPHGAARLQVLQQQQHWPSFTTFMLFTAAGTTSRLSCISRPPM